MSRGYDNNNPGNIRLTDSYWMGETTGSDSDFKTFQSMAWGFRAMIVLLQSYIDKGYDTISKIINRWAPSSENNTSAYINHVVQLSGIGADVQIVKDDEQSMKKLVAAIAWHENGSAPNYTQIDEGYKLTGQVAIVKTVGIGSAALVFVSALGYIAYRIIKVK